MNKLGADHLEMAFAHQNLAEVLAQQGKKDKAETHFLKMIEVVAKNIQQKKTQESEMAAASLTVADFYMMVNTVIYCEMMLVCRVWKSREFFTVCSG
jgi:hypothetical protein